jgi:hypothetical protein
LRSLSTHSRNVAGTDSLCRGTSLNLPVRRIAEILHRFPVGLVTVYDDLQIFIDFLQAR